MNFFRGRVIVVVLSWPRVYSIWQIVFSSSVWFEYLTVDLGCGKIRNLRSILDLALRRIIPSRARSVLSKARVPIWNSLFNYLFNDLNLLGMDGAFPWGLTERSLC